ncbi:MAG: Rne/Rng family ribonuclease [Methyloligellaceae bacterium]
MGSKMLIDAAHPEEVRVVVVRGRKVEDFDYESATRKQLRGNIYLAKVTRVEPSLQAAFVDYGGNRHGFLAFSEIHPDYYQIPVADRKALLEEEAEEESRAEAEEAAQDEADAAQSDRRSGRRRRRGRGRGSDRYAKADRDDERASLALEAADVTESVSEALPDEDAGSEAAGDEALSEDAVESASAELDESAGETGEVDDADASLEASDADGADESDISDDSDISGDAEEMESDNGDADLADGSGQNGNVESVGSEDALEEVPTRARRRRRIYKIQEVIKRRQIILVQVVKEERGNKGAALTTYLSLAGRYTVLMPNTARGGGISRKINQPNDRKRLRKIASDLEVPEGMGLIVRTAGASRTKAEIKRDFEYLLRLWENVRDLTLKSTAPALVYEEGNLIKRSIRDLYNKEIDEISVAGDDAYREAKDFMRMLMPSHAKNVQPYKEPQPIFVRHQVERQLSAMFSPTVTLESGGYIVINQTEALVAIDVNSGKATREHNIEDTALKTNLEASAEISRQLRLRDLAGLIVIDFIDMDERRNNRSVERKLKECLRTDRARIQVGRISHFGLLEMSRQRLRTGVLEGSTTACNVCQGTGVIRSTESVALDVLRTLEDTLMTDGASALTATTSVEAALYILNQKRANLRDIEARYRIPITVGASDQLHGANVAIKRTRSSADDGERGSNVVQMETVFQQTDAAAPETEDESDRKKPRRRRRRKRGKSDRAEGNGVEAYDALEQTEDTVEAEAEPVAAGSVDDADGEKKKPRRRGRRGGRRSRAQARTAESDVEAAPEIGETMPEVGEPADQVSADEAPAVAATDDAPPVEAADSAVEEPSEDAPPKRTSRRGARRKPSPEAADPAQEAQPDEAAPKDPVPALDGNGIDNRPAEAVQTDRNGDARTDREAEPAAPPQDDSASPPAGPTEGAAVPQTADSGEQASDEAKSTGLSALRRRGWWQRRAD